MNTANRRIVLNGKMHPLFALELWHQEVKATGEFLGYTYRSTRKILGMMRNWLNELTAQKLDEEAIRARIRKYVRNWAHVPYWNCALKVFSEWGKTYHHPMPDMPNFDDFYAARKLIVPVLEQTANGRDRALVTKKDTRVVSYW